MAKTVKKVSYTKAWYVVAVLRIMVGFLFLWAYLDKTIGLGLSTRPENSWLDGASPTTGYLNSVDGPFADFFHGLAGSMFIDWIFMLALLGIGLALVFGIGLRAAAVAGSTLLGLLWLASMPMKENPVYDEHVVYAVMLWLFALAPRKWSMFDTWMESKLVKKNTWLW